MKYGFVLMTLILISPRPSVLAHDDSWTEYGGSNRDFVYQGKSPIKQVPLPSTPLWKRPLGKGTSGIVGNGQTLFTLYSVPEPKDPSRGLEVIIALDTQTGKTIWEHKYPVARLKGQQSFSGDPIRPQATPALASGRLCCLGYTGLLKCLDGASGRILWEIDLVKDFDAKPVQFGFSASPLIYRDWFIVQVGGQKASVVAFRQDNGQVVWKSQAAEPSYATPVLEQLGGVEQILQVTRDELLGILPTTGKTLWKYPLPQTGLTNVPTPMALNGNKILVSGQGFLGTRLLKVTPDGEQWQISEVWANTKERYFYCNWVREGDWIIGNNGNFLTAFNWADGKEFWRERGQNESNQIRVGANWFILRGNGLLTQARISPKGIETLASANILKGRCWTPPTLVGGILVARDQDEVVAMKIGN